MEKAVAQKEHKSIHAALLQAKRDMGPVYKNASNPHFRSKYADLAAIVESSEGALQDNGILLTQPLQSEEGKLFVSTILFHAPTETTIESKVEVTSKDPSDPQKIGAALTYFRRYSLLAILGIAPEDDDGNLASQPAARTTASPSRPTPQATPARTSTPTPSVRPADTYSFTGEDGTEVEMVRCEIPGCRSGVRLEKLAANHKYHDGHTICYTHSTNGDWKTALANASPPHSEDDLDPDMIAAINESFPEYANYKTNPDGSVERE